MSPDAIHLLGGAALLTHTKRRAEAFADRQRRIDSEAEQGAIRIVGKWRRTSRDAATDRPKLVFEWATDQFVEIVIDDADALHVATSLRSILEEA